MHTLIHWRYTHSLTYAHTRALTHKHCTLEILRMYKCSITEEGGAALASALRSNSSSHLRELNLLSDLLKDPHCNLETLHNGTNLPRGRRLTRLKYTSGKVQPTHPKARGGIRRIRDVTVQWQAGT
ncbi:hypothetical protein AMELA_G00293010 [Ameiurus melas]|uniref:Uncharacterized protein n=1 Tax=Ameiurus melas TaxID=219545 RepID=A0A7J5ZIF6_AMEME|nr:hypothetical protein AMELA_G00293010 [Ameiurus melas]